MGHGRKVLVGEVNYKVSRDFRKAGFQNTDTGPSVSASIASLFRDLIALTAKGRMTKAKPPQ